MAKPNFIKDLAESHHAGHTDLNPCYNKGLGNRVRGVVEDYDPMDDLPRHEVHGRFGWDRRSPAFKFDAMERWLKAQVGRPIDKVYSELVAQARGNNPTALMARKYVIGSWNDLSLRGNPQILQSRKHGYNYIGLVSVDETHVHPLNHNNLYVNPSGILCQVNPKLLKKLKDMEATRKNQSPKLKVVKGLYYFRLNGTWFELTMEKVVWKRDSYGFLGYSGPDCLICKKLGVYWRYDNLKLFDRSDIYCTAMRTASKKEINTLLLDV